MQVTRGLFREQVCGVVLAIRRSVGGSVRSGFLRLGDERGGVGLLRSAEVALIWSCRRLSTSFTTASERERPREEAEKRAQQG